MWFHVYVEFIHVVSILVRWDIQADMVGCVSPSFLLIVVLVAEKSNSHWKWCIFAIIVL